MEENTPEPQLDEKQQKAFGLAKRSAKQVLRRRFRVLRLVRDAYAKLFSNEQALTKVREDLGVMLRLSKSWAKREYRHVPWKSLLYAVAAIVYFVNPIDLIPDAIAGLGFVDDVAVIGAVVAAIRNDLEQFLSWEQDARQLEE